MKTQMRWAMVVVVGTVAMAGCGERTGVRASSQVVVSPATSVAAPAPAPVACPMPAVAATAAAPAAPEPRRISLGADEKLSVRRLVLAGGVKNREPVDPGTSFKGARKVYAFVEVENRAGAPAEIVVEFEPPGGGTPHGDVTLAVGPSARWRTWAYTRTASSTGSWTAVVKNRKGEVLARAPFEITL